MLFQSEVITAASGSVGGVTYSHNRGGMYRRARAIPVDPQTSNQTEVRNALTDLINRWNDTLSEAQREAWRLYGENVPVTNALGASILLSGQNWYVGDNTARLQAISKLTSTLLRIDDAPTIFNRGDFTDVTSTSAVATGITVNYTNTDDWANEDEAAMFIYQGRPQNASRKYFKGPWRLIAEVLGDGTTPPTSPEIIAPATLASLGYVEGAGQNSNITVVVVRADGRTTSRRKTGPAVVA